MTNPKPKTRIRPNAKGLVEFMVTSGYGGNTHEPFVEVDVNGHITQMSPEQARAVGLNFLQAAEAAESDAAIMAFAKSMDMDTHRSAQLLRTFRQLRREREGKSAETA